MFILRCISTFLLISVPIGATILSSSLAGRPLYDLLIVIPTATHELERRTAIRNSWAQYASSPQCEPCRKRKVKVLFVAGQEGNQRDLSDEAAKFGDLGVLSNFGQFEYYTARAEKTQRSLRYAIDNFRFRLLFKTDTDSWIFMDRLLLFLEEHSLFSLSPDLPGIYGGDFADGTDVHAVEDPNAKWFDGIFRKFTGQQIYPKHAKGAGYLLSPDLVEFIASSGPGTHEGTHEGKQAVAPSKDVESNNDEEGGQWARMPRLEDLPSEDVSVGFWLQVVNHTKISMPVSIKDTACTTDSSRHLVVDHYVSPEEMSLRWCRYIQAHDPCDQTVLKSTCTHINLNAQDLSKGSERPKLALLASALRNAEASRTAASLKMLGESGQARKGSTESHRGSLLSALRAQQRRASGSSPGAPTEIVEAVHKVVSGEKHAWMLMQHGASMSWVTGQFPQS